MIELKASPHCCEEASMLSRDFYIPCNKPAERIISWPERGEGPYRMCAECGWHSVKNRRATDLGEYDAKAA